jgi:hypothetical protein
MIPLSGFLARNPAIAIISIQGIAILGGFCSAWTKASFPRMLSSGGVDGDNNDLASSS